MGVYWLEQCACDVPLGENWLSRAEMRTLERLTIPKRRADWRLGRWTAKLAVAAYLHLVRHPEVLATIEARAAGSGAPEAFVQGRPAPFSLSLSHSGGIGFCAIAAAGSDIGCDVEKVAPRSREFVEDYFTAEEREVVWRTPAAGRDLLATLLWSAKESALKALHCGLRVDTRSVTARPAGVAAHEGGTWRPLTVSQSGGATFHGWWREDRGFAWTLVTSCPFPEIAARLES